MKIEKIAQMVEAAFQGYGCYHYEKIDTDVYAILFDDYHIINNVKDMVSIINDRLVVFEIYQDSMYMAMLMTEDLANKYYPLWDTNPSAYSES